MPGTRVAEQWGFMRLTLWALAFAAVLAAGVVLVPRFARADHRALATVGPPLSGEVTADGSSRNHFGSWGSPLDFAPNDLNEPVAFRGSPEVMFVRVTVARSCEPGGNTITVEMFDVEERYIGRVVYSHVRAWIPSGWYPTKFLYGMSYLRLGSVNVVPGYRDPGCWTGAHVHVAADGWPNSETGAGARVAADGWLYIWSY